MAAAADWTLEDRGPAPVVRCAALDRCAGVRHAFSTAAGDHGPLDAGPAVPAAPSRAAREAIARAAGIDPAALRTLHQVHGDLVIDAGIVEPQAPPDADGAWARRDGTMLAPAVRTADCAPVLLADRDGCLVAAVHAGWRGVAAGILQVAVERLVAGGVGRADLVAAIGPAAAACCYEVADDVAEAVARGAGVERSAVGRPGRRVGHPYLDLPGAVRLALETAGVPRASIHVAPWCTICSGGRFHSFRRDGAAAGRALAVVGWESGLP